MVGSKRTVFAFVFHREFILLSNVACCEVYRKRSRNEMQKG